MSNDPGIQVDGMAYLALKNSACYGNAKAVRAVLKSLGVSPLNVQEAMTEDGDLSFDFQREATILNSIVKEFTFHYNTRFAASLGFMDGEMDDDPSNWDALIQNWAHRVASPYLASHTDYFDENTDRQDYGEIVYADCGDYEGVIDVLVEMGAPITWDDYKQLYDIPPDDPVKKKIKSAAAHSIFSEVLVVNHFSPADFFEGSSDLTAGYKNSQKMQLFYGAMQAIAKENNDLEIIEYGPGHCIFGGPEDVLQRAIFNEFQNYYTERLPRSLVEVARIGKFTGIETLDYDS